LVLLVFHFVKMKDKRPPHARSLSPFLCSTPARLPALLHPAQLRLLLGFDLRLDPLFGPPFPHPHHSIRPTHRVQTLLLVHRFFSQARWNLDELGHCVFQLLLPFCSEVLVGAVDDTLARKSGRHIWGAGMHHDPLRSTQKRPFFAFGHNFVVFSLQVALPFAPTKYWAFPILVRMYRKRQTNQRAPGKGGKLERKPGRPPPSNIAPAPNWPWR
jgi:hypothetical protein